MDNAHKMAGIPVVIVHGRCDFVCRPAAAYHLFKALEPGKARLEMVAGAGHSDSEPGIIDGLVHATDDFRRDDGDSPAFLQKIPEEGGGGGDRGRTASGGQLEDVFE